MGILSWLFPTEDDRLRRARKLMAAGRHEDARRMALAARSADPRSPEPIAIEVEVLRALGDNERLAKSLRDLAAARTEPTEKAKTLVELAAHLDGTLKRPDDALRALE